MDDLMERFQSGDEGAFAEIVASFKGRLFRYILRFVRDPDEAEDLLQDLFVRLFRIRESYRPEQKLEHLLYRIASNLCKDRWRRKRILPGPDPDSVASSAPGPEEEAENRMERNLLDQAIRTLPAQQQIVLNLAIMEGRSYEEVREITGLSLSAVKSLLFRARTTLKKKIGPQLS